MSENEVQLDSTLEIIRLRGQIEYYKSAFEKERVWRWAFWFISGVIVSISIYDFWIK